MTVAWRANILMIPNQTEEAKMTGMLVSILPKTDFDFSSAGSSSFETVIARALNVIPYREGVLVLRVHGDYSAGGGRSLKVHVRNTAPSADDPSTEFTDATPIATCTLTLTTGGPTVSFESIGATFSPYVKISLAAAQTTQNAAFTASVSVDLVLRE